jgi:23S rRNA pseudouridine1911/1915/1917 synthase
MPEQIKYRDLVVPEEQAGARIDSFLSYHVNELSRTAAQRSIERGEVQVDGWQIKPGYRVSAGQRVTVILPPPEATEILAEDIPLAVVYEDHDLIVINKEAPMVTHPARGNYSGTLVNALLAHCTDLSGVGGSLRPGIVHRLDKDTSGLIVAAKNDEAHRGLAAQLAARTMHRSYLALVWGEPEWSELLVDAAIDRHPQNRHLMIVSESGRASRTTLRCVERFGCAALLRAELETGRTHQVRVHCTHLGHPLLGDPLYGRRRARELGPLPEPVAAAVKQLPGQALHAGWLHFDHPRDGRLMEFAVEPPSSFRAVWEALRQAVPPAP